jgi:hypothetical protein
MIVRVKVTLFNYALGHKEVLDGDEWSTSRPDCFTSGDGGRCALSRRLGVTQSRPGRDDGKQTPWNSDIIIIIIMVTNKIGLGMYHKWDEKCIQNFTRQFWSEESTLKICA